jgi:DegV family protein with EDD domain
MSEKIGFVCDSTADFPTGLARKLRIHTLPVHIMVGEQDHLHGVSISNTDVISTMQSNQDVSTKPFYPFECADFYEKLLGKYEKIVSFHLSTELSGCYKSAVNARNLLFSDDADRIKILDLGSVSVSLGLVVKKAVQLLKQDGNLDTIERRLAPYKKHTFMGFTVDNLKWLKKGGRVSAFSAFVGGMLDIKPIINLDNAKLVPIEKHRGKKPALKRLVTMAEEKYRQLKGNCNIWLAYAGNKDEAMLTREKLAMRIGRKPEEMHLAEVGATISVHTGPGSVCIAMSPN